MICCNFLLFFVSGSQIDKASFFLYSITFLFFLETRLRVLRIFYYWKAVARRKGYFLRAEKKRFHYKVFIFFLQVTQRITFYHRKVKVKKEKGLC